VKIEKTFSPYEYTFNYTKTICKNLLSEVLVIQKELSNAIPYWFRR
jgi:hypothetical protein